MVYICILRNTHVYHVDTRHVSWMAEPLIRIQLIQHNTWYFDINITQQMIRHNTWYEPGYTRDIRHDQLPCRVGNHYQVDNMCSTHISISEILLMLDTWYSFTDKSSNAPISMLQLLICYMCMIYSRRLASIDLLPSDGLQTKATYPILKWNCFNLL